VVGVDALLFVGLTSTGLFATVQLWWLMLSQIKGGADAAAAAHLEWKGQYLWCEVALQSSKAAPNHASLDLGTSR
jgi:hypothetical protein